MLKAASADLVEAAFFCDAQMLIADATTPDCSGAGGSAQHRSHEKLDLQIHYVQKKNKIKDCSIKKKSVY